MDEAIQSGQHVSQGLQGLQDHSASKTESEEMTSKATRVEFGCVGHCIVGRNCLWRRHTQVAGFRISSVGNYYSNGKRETLGAGDDSFFETMVFATTNKRAKCSDGCGCMEVSDWCEIDGERYATAGKAQAGHEKYVKKYMSKNVKRRTRK